MALAGVLAYLQARQALQDAVIERLKATVTFKQGELERWVDDVYLDSVSLAASSLVQNAAQDLLTTAPATTEHQNAQALLFHTFADHISQHGHWREVFIVNLADGKVKFATDPQMKGLEFIHENPFATSSAPLLQKVYYSDLLKKHTLTVLAPILDERRQPIGALAAHLNLDRMSTVILESASLGNGAETYLVMAGGQVVAGLPDRNQPEAQSAGIYTALLGTEIAGPFENYAHVPVIGAYRPISTLGMVLVSEIPQDQALAPADRLAWTNFVLGMVAVTVMTIGGWWLARQIVKPILSITNAALQFTNGDLTQLAPVTTNDEISVLARAFNLMTTRLRQSLTNMEQEVAERKRAEAELRQRANELEALAAVSSALRAATTRTEMLPVVLQQMADLFKAQGMAFMATRPEAREAQVEVAQGRWTAWHHQRLSLQTGLNAHLMRSAQVYVTEHTTAEQLGYALDLAGLTALACVPLVAQEQVIGTVWVGRLKAFDDAEQRLLVAVGNIVANALYRATAMEMLEQKVTERTQELAQRIKQLDLINQVGRYATLLLDQAALLPDLATLIRATFNYYAALILMAEPDGQTLNLVTAATADAMDMADLLEQGVRVPFGQGSIGLAASTGEPAVVADTRADPRGSSGQLPLTRSQLILPLRVGNQVLGVLDLESKVVGAFRQDDVRVMQTLADQIAVAIHNADMFRAAQAARSAAENARAEAEGANRLKSQFLTTMSHELRTPLNAIINFAYLMSLGTEGEVTTGQEDLLNRIGEAGRHLLDLINDILDISKIEAGKLELYPEDLDVRDLVESLMPTVAGLVHNKPIALRQSIPAALPTVRADRKRISQVLLNLLSNAVKFTERGEIVVQAEVTGQCLTVSVRDTGQGITAEDLPRVFIEFVQIDGEMSRESSGAGLGLPISRKLIELHGGQLWAESQAGVGSAFFFTLPLQPEVAPPPTLPDHAVTEARVLVVDDDPIARKMLVSLLADMGGYQVIKVSDSRQALATMLEHRPDIVLLDILMPHLDGWEVLKAIKSDPDVNHIPVVMCSVLREERQALSLAANEYLAKPVERRELRRVIERFVPPGGKVMVVDDDPDTLEIIRRMLDGVSYKIETEKDGAGGVRALRDHAPDLLLLDLVMPDMSGYEVLAQLHNDPRIANTAIVIVTSHELTEAERQQLPPQVTANLRKGAFTADEFATIIRRAMGRRTLANPQLEHA